MVRSLTRDEVVDRMDSLGADSLRDVDLEAMIDGNTALELCLNEFNLVALEEPDCVVCGMWELHHSAIALLEAGATITPAANTLLNELKTMSDSVKMIRRVDPNEYDGVWGAENEADAIIACAATMRPKANTKRRAGSDEAKTGAEEPDASTSGEGSSTTQKKQKA